MNEAIRNYIESQFMNLPDTPAVKRAQQELLQMSEDKYAELLAAGVSDNEATGRVITEFGNINELADELGIRGQFDEANGAVFSADTIELTVHDSAEAGEAVQAAIRSAIVIALGVFVLIGALITTAIFDSEGSFTVSASNAGFEAILNLNALPLVLGVAIAVPAFIMGSALNRKFRPFEQGQAALDYHTMKEYQQKLNDNDLKYHTLISLGVALILAGLPLPALINDMDWLPLFGAMLGVPILIVNGRYRTALYVLSKANSKNQKRRQLCGKFESLSGIIACIYWPIVVLIYLAWSFFSDGWNKSWVIFPLAAILFAALLSIVYLWFSRKVKNTNLN